MTGAGRGIGRAIAERFGREGARVVVNDIGAHADDVALAVTQAGGEGLGVVADVSHKDEVDRLFDSALDALPIEFREVVILRDIEDMSYKEIAGVAAIPIGTVMSRLARGRRLLLDELARRRAGDPDGL